MKQCILSNSNMYSCRSDVLPLSADRLITSMLTRQSTKSVLDSQKSAIRNEAVACSNHSRQSSNSTSVVTDIFFFSKTLAGLRLTFIRSVRSIGTMSLIEMQIERISLQTLIGVLCNRQTLYDCIVCSERIQMNRIYHHSLNCHFDVISTIVPCMICGKRFRLMEKATLARKCSMMAFITHTTLCVLSLQENTPAVINSRRSYCAKIRTLSRKLGFSMPVHRIYDYSLDKTRIVGVADNKWGTRLG